MSYKPPGFKGSGPFFCPPTPCRFSPAWLNAALTGLLVDGPAEWPFYSPAGRPPDLIDKDVCRFSGLHKKGAR